MNENKSTKPKRKSLKIMLYIFGALIALIVIWLTLGYLFQVQATKQFAEKFPAKGQLVDVNGHKMHIYCTGEGDKTVILDVGNGRTSLDWSLVQPELSKTARVCIFDRAGYGWSDPATTPRTGKNIVEEQKKMLEAAGITGPYILVGHSGGGMYARIFAKYYPEDVEGIVLVDSAATSADTLPALQKATMMQTQQMKVMKLLSTFNILPVLGKIGGEKAIPDFIKKLPEELHTPYLASLSRPSQFEAMLKEEEQLSTKDSEVWQELNSITDFGDIPVVILSAQHTFPTSIANAEEINEYLQQSQKDLLKLSTNAKQIVAEKSSHDIHLDQPELIIQAVKDILIHLQ